MGNLVKLLELRNSSTTTGSENEKCGYGEDWASFAGLWLMPLYLFSAERQLIKVTCRAFVFVSNGAI